jgi:hypothetical protein
MRKRYPTANELVYHYASSFVIGYSPTERGSDAVVALSFEAKAVRLVFNHGPALPDPGKLLLGSGKQTRHIQIESPRTLTRPAVKALLDAAGDRARTALRAHGRARLILKPASAAR